MRRIVETGPAVSAGGRRVAYAAVMVGLLCGCGPAPQARHPDEDGTRVLEGVLSTYAGLKTYDDSGVVISTYWPEQGGRIHGGFISFRTAFSRPDSFRFVYTDAFNASDEKRPGLVLSTPAGVWSRSAGEEEIETARSGEEAVNAFVGVTRGSVDIAWSLLARRNPWQCKGNSPRAVTAIGREPIAGKTCLKLHVERPPCDSVDLWIDESTNLVRKVQERGHLAGTSARKNLDELLKIAPPELHDALRRTAERAGPFFYERTIYFGPRVDQEIAPEQFQKPTPDGSPAP
jgi:hypothetical protein